MASLLPLIAVGTPMGIEGVAHVMVAVEMLMHWDHGMRLATLPCLVG